MINNNSQVLNLVVTFCLIGLMGACSATPIDVKNNLIDKSHQNFSSFYITMPDGTKLAADLRLPKQFDGKLPTLLELTRYWRSDDKVPQNNDASELVQSYLDAGFAYIMVDVRGTGASFGIRDGEYALSEVLDDQHVIDWISKQVWSNGNVAAIGVSYTANTAELTALYPHPALKAAVPLFTDYDWYESIVLPGGIKNKYIAERWAEGARALDLNDVTIFGPQDGAGTEENPLVLGVRPVDGEDGKTLLLEASKIHQGNRLIREQLRNLIYRDEYPIAKSITDPKDKNASIHRFQKRFEEVALPMFQRGSWFDAGTASGILGRFINFDTPYNYEIGPWSHGAMHDANPFNEKDMPVQPSVAEQYQKIFEFLAPFVKDNSSVIKPEKKLTYFTVGSNQWKQTKVWPPKGHRMQRLWLDSHASLSEVKPKVPKAEDNYAVNYDVGSGSSSRWATQLGGGDVYYPDRAEADKMLLTYTTAPFEESIEITGTPIISLEVASTHSDGAFIVYLEDVDAAGEVRMLTEGGLRAIHRKISKPEGGYKTLGPYHSFLKADALPLVAGEVSNLTFSMLPISVQIAKGHSLRIAIAGHDKDTFIRIPDKGDPVITVYRNATNASFIDLPIISVTSSNP